MEFKTEKQIYADAINDAVSRGLISVDEETLQKILEGTYTANQYALDLATHSYINASTENKAKEIYEDMDITTATGEALDRFGRLVNVARVQAKPAMVDITLSVATAGDSDLTVPAGTRVLIDEVVTDSDMYVVESDIVIASGSTSASGVAVCIDNGFRDVVPVGTVRGVNGFSTVTASNSNAGVNGSDVESDDSYRQRIMKWASGLVRGSRQMIENYLQNYNGLDSYKLIPRYDGVGTLKIVCDTLESLLDTIASDVDENCMVITDAPVVCVLPTSQTLSTLSLACVKGVLGNLTEGELTQIIQGQVQTFVEGGTTRTGEKYGGMSIGEDFYPSQLIKFLQEQIPEVLNFSTTMTPVTVADLNKFHITEVSVSYA